MKMRSRRATCGGRCLSVLSLLDRATGMGFVLEFDDMCFKLLTSMCARAACLAGLSASARAAARERQRALINALIND